MIPVESPLLELDVEDDINSEPIMADNDDRRSPNLWLPSESQEDSSTWLRTDPDSFDLFHQYQNMLPTYDPENMSYFGQFCDALTFDHSDSNPDNQQPWYSGLSTLFGTTNHQFFAPFLNATSYRLMSWFYNLSSSKSLNDLDRLVNNVIFADDFN